MPYCILAVSYPLHFKGLEKGGNIAALVIAYGSYMVMSFSYGRAQFFNWNIMQEFYILFPFILGAVTARCNIIEKAKEIASRMPVFVPYIILALWFIIRAFLPTGAVAAIYCAGLAVIISSMRKPKWLSTGLLALGKQSTGMWFVHYWIYWVLLKDFTYGLGNPLLITVFVTVVSYVIAIVFDKIYNVTIKKLIG